MNIKLNKKQLIEVYKAGYITSERVSYKGCQFQLFNDGSELLNKSGFLLIRVKIASSHGKRKVFISVDKSGVFNQYAAIKKIEELLNWK